MDPMRHNSVLVVLSIAIAMFASYTALDLGGRLRGTFTGPRWAWVLAAAVAMGGGIWSMHFVGMLAFDTALPVAYDVGRTLASLLIAVGVTGVAFAWSSRREAGRRDVLVSGLVMGAGVAAMHYTGMAAIEMSGTIAYNPLLIVASILIAVTAATAALWLTFRQNGVWQKLAAAAVMGLAVAGMHYTGMSAATFTFAAGGMAAHAHLGAAMGQQNLALSVAGATFLILFLAMLASSFDQQRIQGALRASEERFRAAAEAVGDIIWTNDAQGEMRGPQPDWERFTGQTEAEYQGFGWAKAVHADDVQPTVNAWNEAVSHRRVFLFEHRVRRHDGVYRLFSIRAVPVLEPDGRIREWVGVHEDITERREFEMALKAARDEAEAANLAKSTFIANMSHELRTPLSAIIGYSEMMLEEIADGEDTLGLAADMTKIESNARHLLGLINDVLDLSKIESGKMEVFSEEFGIESVVRDLATTVQSLVGKKNNRLDLQLAPNLGEMRSDVTKVRQILLNLLSNAAKFTEAGVLTLAVSREHGLRGDRILFRVSDTGIGMSQPQLAKLFQRFQQADESTTRRFGGTGLGLSLTRAFTTMLGGRIDVESIQGQGSTFTVSLPATIASTEIDAESQADQHSEETGDLVLVIDDDADQRALMTRFLRREGFRARTAADGINGLALAQELKPRAIVLDVMMPGVDGWSVLSALKDDPALKEIPVIMVTFVEQRALAASLGAADYVMKPVRWDRLKSVMDRYRPPETDALIIDDDPNTRTLIRTALERDGWSVTEAGNGQEGLAQLAAARPGIVLLDLSMPIMDGFTFLETMRARPGCGTIPVVVLTALDLTQADRRRLQGATQILNKGDVSIDKLAERLCGLQSA
ncbi:response regulator [Lichenifustis flavocetrariae]|uniref:histidine kinase n=1 Tax=Lichenifustis flavocetrariae TaxID=2949735 RepID=A0AA42CKT2_9HYPH|nr:response regulator [Lichenifustis flavocetrariae]MCW6506677.1 response regulator [Lichenifustis flavocetrariae]